MMYMCTGLRVNLECLLEVTVAQALNHKYDHIDIYSNSWGPADRGYQVDGPGETERLAFIDGVTNVCSNTTSLVSLLITVSRTVHQIWISYLYPYRAVMAKVRSMSGQLEMEEIITIPVQLMAMPPVYTLLLLVQLIRVVDRHSMMRTAPPRWQ